MSHTTQLQSLDAGTRRREARTVIASSYLGSTIEYSDFLLYATAAAVVFPKVFFSGMDDWVGVVAAYGTFAAGYVARPLGGIIFGHFGDKLGRTGMLIVSMLVMGIASTLIGLVPDASVAGPWGAVLRVILRIFQGIAVGGEWGGAALMALEHSESGKRGFAASFVNAGAPTGAVRYRAETRTPVRPMRRAPGSVTAVSLTPRPGARIRASGRDRFGIGRPGPRRCEP